MTMVNSQVKGKTFEREVAHLLTKLTGAAWRRVPNSGAFSTMYQVQDSRFKGDLYCEDKQYENWLIECKVTGEQINLEALTSEKSQIWKWLAQAREEAKGKMPVLIFSYRSRGGHSPTFAIMNEGHPAMQLLTESIGIVRGSIGELVLGTLRERKE